MVGQSVGGPSLNERGLVDLKYSFTALIQEVIAEDHDAPIGLGRLALIKDLNLRCDSIPWLNRV